MVTVLFLLVVGFLMVKFGAPILIHHLKIKSEELKGIQAENKIRKLTSRTLHDMNNATRPNRRIW